MAHTLDMPAIGIDGGGTLCRIALRRQGAPDLVVECGPANVSVDFDGTIRRVRDGLLRLADRAGEAEGALARFRAHAGLAGVLDDDMAARVAHGLPLRDLGVSDDRKTTLAGALGAVDGAVVGIGTGSFLGRRAGAATQLLGGWGVRLGDQASGAWLGRLLLQETLMSVDGMRPASDLTDGVLRRFRDAPAEVVAFGQRASPADFAAFAPEIVSAAAAGDPVGVSLVSEGVRYIEEALSTLGWTPGEALCLTGGLAPHYAQFLPPAMTPALRKPAGSALDGAIALAREAAMA